MKEFSWLGYTVFFCGYPKRCHSKASLKEHLYSEQHRQECSTAGFRNPEQIILYLAYYPHKVSYGFVKAYLRYMDSCELTLNSKVYPYSLENVRPTLKYENSALSKIGHTLCKMSRDIVERFAHEYVAYTVDYSTYDQLMLQSMKFYIHELPAPPSFFYEFAVSVSRPLSDWDEYYKHHLDDKENFMYSIQYSYRMAICTSLNIRFTIEEQLEIIKTFYGAYLFIYRPMCLPNSTPSQSAKEFIEYYNATY